MSLTTAMLTGFTGIQANGMAVDTVGNNLANLNTTAFKSQRTLFETLLYRTISEGSGPNDESGGTLPRQIGLGTTVGSMQRNFQQGGFDSTGLQGDLAIDGQGFFVLDAGGGETVFTRDGAFHLDQSQTLVSAGGASLLAFRVDATGAIVQGDLSSIVIPLGSASAAIPTTAVMMDGRLDSGTSIASSGAIVASQPMMIAGGAAATAGTSLTSLVDSNGVPLFSSDDVLAVGGVKGGVTMPDKTFVVGVTGSTLGDLATFMQSALGIDVNATDGSTPGVVIGDGTTFPEGSLVIQSNVGEANAIALSSGSITNTTGATTSPFAFASVQEALGAGPTTTFRVFDSLGNSVDVRLRLALESKSESGTVWRFWSESLDDTDLSPLLGSGTITFDADGQFVGSTGTELSIDRAGVGSVSPLSFSLDLSTLTGLASADGSSEIIMASQDGAPAGIMTGYSIDAEGLITATFSNQHTETLGQVALATFANNEGLIGLSGNRYAIGPDSGAATVIAPRTGLAGSIRSGALEQSNVELAREFIGLISASTGISSASRVVRVADELLQELLLLAR